MYATDRRQTASSLYAPPIRDGGITNHVGGPYTTNTNQNTIS